MAALTLPRRAGSHGGARGQQVPCGLWHGLLWSSVFAICSLPPEQGRRGAMETLGIQKDLGEGGMLGEV